MANWVPNLGFIINGEGVNETTIGRITRQLAQRTDYLFEGFTELDERKQRVQIDNLFCNSIFNDSLVNGYRIAYQDSGTGLLELADGADTSKTNILGVAINPRSVVGGFKCDLVFKGLVTIPQARLADFVEEGSWSPGAIAYLSTPPTPAVSTDYGKITFVEPTLSVPVGLALPQDPTTGDYPFVMDPDPYLNLKHRHVREVLDWSILMGGSHPLTFEPTSPDAVFATIDEIVLKFDDDNIGSFTNPGDPDYTVATTTFTLYSPVRFIGLNPFDPKVVVWYSTPFGDNQNVTGLIAGHNVTLSSCNQNGAVSSGLVTINSIPNINKDSIGNDDVKEHVKTITVNPATFALDIACGGSVTRLIPGINIYFTGDEGPNGGQGIFSINARPDRNSYELVQPESTFLENAKEDLIFDKFHAYVLESGRNQSVIVTFRVPEYVSTIQKPKLVLDYLVGTNDATNPVELSIEYQELVEDSSLATASPTSFVQSVTVDATKYRKRIPLTIDLDFTVSKNSTLVFFISRSLDVVNDAYTGNFNILHSRLRITPEAV